MCLANIPQVRNLEKGDFRLLGTTRGHTCENLGACFVISRVWSFRRLLPRDRQAYLPCSLPGRSALLSPSPLYGTLINTGRGGLRLPTSERQTARHVAGQPINSRRSRIHFLRNQQIPLWQYATLRKGWHDDANVSNEVS